MLHKGVLTIGLLKNMLFSHYLLLLNSLKKQCSIFDPVDTGVCGWSSHLERLHNLPGSTAGIHCQSEYIAIFSTKFSGFSKCKEILNCMNEDQALLLRFETSFGTFFLIFFLLTSHIVFTVKNFVKKETSALKFHD